MKKPNTEYEPNNIPKEHRKFFITLSSFILGYGVIGLMIDDIYIPGKFHGHHFHGSEVWLMFGAFFFASVNLMLIVVDHYDKRNNEKYYNLLARLTQFTSLTLFILAHLIS